jgi:hypothetical protein
MADSPKKCVADFITALYILCKTYLGNRPSRFDPYLLFMRYLSMPGYPEKKGGKNQRRLKKQNRLRGNGCAVHVPEIMA